VGLALALVRALLALARRAVRGRSGAFSVLAGALLTGLGAYWLPQSALAVRAFSDEERLFGTTVANHPDEVEPLVNLASVYLERRRYDRAAPILERASALAPHDLGVVRNRFALLWQTEQVPAALDLLRGVFESRSPDIDRELRFGAGYQLMIALLQTGRLDEAERIFARLRAEYPRREELKLDAQRLRAAP
jgi:tetratricopeptide (TPR) repeat protein